MQSKNNEKVIAIFIADIHLSLNPPIWRSAEDNWKDVMKKPLDEIKELQNRYNCPVICAGDIFDKWNSSAELINFAIDNLPRPMYCIPGQHDLPLHNIEDIEKSAYWTIYLSDIIKDISNTKDGIIPDEENKIALYGFPFGMEIKPLNNKTKGYIHIAVIHQYAWITGHSYPDAPNDSYLHMNEKNLMGYDIIVYGDNHKGFKTTVNNKSTIFNCGTLMRRKSDEINYKPQIGLLLNTGEVKTHYLDISKDKYLDSYSKEENNKLDMDSFFKELEKLGETNLDFTETIKQYMDKEKVKTEVRNIIYKAMEKTNG